MPFRKTAAALVTVLSLAGAGGCSSPCQDIAEIACRTAGEGSAECKAVRDKAARATSEDREACEVALELVESLEKVR